MSAMAKELGPKGLAIVCFPCNQFGKQEPGTNAEIKAFVEDKFDFSGEGVYLMDKIDVNGPNTHPVWEFLKAKYPGDVSWNFAAKFLVDKNGEVVERNGLGAGESKAKLVAML
jgi:glutathione peroxidase-family protein